MITDGFILEINSDYGLELDSFLGAIYLPWHTIIITALAVVAYKAYKIYLKRNGLVGWKY
jgi:hypothetical protein